MKKRILWLTVNLLWIITGIAQPYVSSVWVSDQGDGTYINPILHANYSDPDVCAVGEDFYMTASSFNCTPGLPVLHSKDLVNWRILNYALEILEPREFFSTPQHGKGVWAPSIRYHNGEFYIYWGDPDWGIFMVKTKDPAGEWEKPVLVKPGKGMIDPTPLWDDDGRVYLVHAWAGSRAGINSTLVICEMNREGTAVISPPVMVFDGNDGVNHTIEGPKLYKRNGYYYIFAPAGGVERGWQLVLRSESIYGPYEPKIVMAQGDTDINGPHQGAWIDTESGESWFIHFQDREMYGRIIHLNPVKWVNDWPVIGVDKDGSGCGEPVRRYKKPAVKSKWGIETPAESDEFDTRNLGLQWQWHANYQDFFGVISDMGFMRIYGYTLSEDFKNFWEVPNLLLQKFPAETFTATTKLTFTAKEEGEKAGLIIMGWNYSYLSVCRKGDGFVLEQSVCKDAEQGNPEIVKELAQLPVSGEYKVGSPNYLIDIYMRVQVKPGGECSFFYSTDGEHYLPAGEPFTAHQGKWIGAKTGFFCVNPHGVSMRGWVDVDWFRIEKRDPN
ncbi:MAG: glycoside hydrolase 43 family protein [Bacteroides sp.]|nr:glycoside hydrolase 43 family protein [Bacteroides sp.]